MLPRQRLIPCRVDDGHRIIILSHLKIVFGNSEVLDLLVSDITQRFNQPAFSIPQEIKRMIIDSCHGKPMLCLQILKYYMQFAYKFQSQNLNYPYCLKTGNIDYKMGIKKVTTLNTVC